MKIVYLVEGNTRVILSDNSDGANIIARWIARGIKFVRTDEDPSTCYRTSNERSRALRFTHMGRV